MGTSLNNSRLNEGDVVENFHFMSMDTNLEQGLKQESARELIGPGLDMRQMRKGTNSN